MILKRLGLKYWRLFPISVNLDHPEVFYTSRTVATGLGKYIAFDLSAMYNRIAQPIDPDLRDPWFFGIDYIDTLFP